MSRFYWRGVVTITEIRGDPLTSTYFPPGCLLNLVRADGNAGVAVVTLHGFTAPGAVECISQRWHRDSHGNVNSIGSKNPTNVLPEGFGHITDPLPGNTSGRVFIDTTPDIQLDGHYEYSSLLWRAKPYVFGQSLTNEAFRVKPTFGPFSEWEWPSDITAPYFTGDHPSLTITGSYARYIDDTHIDVIVCSGPTPAKAEVPEFPFIWDAAKWKLSRGVQVLSVDNATRTIPNVPGWNPASNTAPPEQCFTLTTTSIGAGPLELDPPYILCSTGGPYDYSADGVAYHQYGLPIPVDYMPVGRTPVNMRVYLGLGWNQADEDAARAAIADFLDDLPIDGWLYNNDLEAYLYQQGLVASVYNISPTEPAPGTSLTAGDIQFDRPAFNLWFAEPEDEVRVNLAFSKDVSAQGADISRYTTSPPATVLEAVVEGAGVRLRFDELAYATEYTITVDPALTAADGTTLSTNVAYFLTGSPPVEAGPISAQLVALPSVQLEKLTPSTDEATLPRIVNRIPEPDEVEVPHTTRGTPTRIVFQLLASSVFTPDPGGLQIFVDGETVHDGDGFHDGWAGAFTPVGGAGYRVSLRRPAAFASAHRTEVEVVQDGDLLASWAFTWKDESPPEVEDATPESLLIVRVTFDEPVDPATALVPSRYRLRAISAFAHAPTPVYVAPGASAREVWVAFDQPLTFGATYALGVQGVTDRYGNLVVDSEAAQRTFVAARPAVPDGRRFVLWDFIPDLYKRLDQDRGDLEKFIRVLQEPTDVLLHEVDRFAQLADPDLAPEDFVEAMLADLGCPFNLTGLDLGDKRKLLGLLLSIYQQKGTTEGLIDAARALLGLEIAVLPLNEGGWMLGVHELGNPETTWLAPETSFQRFAFEVAILNAIGREPTEEERERLIELVHVMRPAHTHFRRLVEMTSGYYPEA